MIQANAQTRIGERAVELSHVIDSRSAEYWPTTLILAFRFTFAYLLLYTFPFPLNQIPWIAAVSGFYEKLWQKIVPWVGAHVLHLAEPITYFPSGSGDKISNWVQLLCEIVLAIAITAIWSGLDRRRKNYTLLHAWMRVYLITYLGIGMLNYGVAKVIPSQMPYPILSHMMEPFGYQSPMGLIWSSIGAAPSYEIFSGAVELLGGVLLFVPQMTTLGALVTLAAVSEVFTLNMCYDIPLKMFSGHLVAFSVLLLLPDRKRLTDFFVLNRAAQRERLVPLFRRRFLNYAVWGVRWALAILVICTGVVQFGQYYSMVKNLPTTNPMYGIWRIDQFTLDGKEHPPLTTDNQRWERMIFDYKTDAAIQDMRGVPLLNSIGAPIRFSPTVDTKNKTLTLKNPSDPAWEFEANYDREQPDRMTMDGQWNGKPLHLLLIREHPRFFLSGRGFHWVNQISLNR